MNEIENGPPLIIGVDFTVGRPEPVDFDLAFNTLTAEELAAARKALGVPPAVKPR